MERAEAIEQLQNCKDLIKQDGQDYLDERDFPLLDMAIEALSKPNYESDNEVRLAVTDRNKDKVVLWDAFGEQEYYPTTHGRLIDADALMKELSDIQPYNWTESEAEIQEEADYSLFKSLINSAPTVQADRPHGEWIFVEEFMGINRYKCSVCEREELLTYLKNFCSNCGARMKGADDE